MPSSYTSSFPSTPSLVSVNTITSTSSTTPLRHISSSSSSSSSSPSPSSLSSSSSHSSSPQPVQKDFSKSFGLLQSQYGWGPMTSVPVRSRTEDTEPKKNRREERDMRSRTVQKKQETERGSESSRKDYQSVFGSLSWRYSFGGSLQTPSRK